MENIQIATATKTLLKKFTAKKITGYNSIMLLLTAIAFSLLFSACQKEPVSPGIVQNKDRSYSTRTTLHPTGVLPDDPSLLEKVGYYQVAIGLRQNVASSIDLSGKMPVVENQGAQSSCVGWAVGYYNKTYHEVVEKGWDANKNAYSPSWIYNQINSGVDGGSHISDAMNLLDFNGCDFKDNFSYSSADYTTQPDQGSKINAKHYRSSSWQYVQRDVNDFKAILSSSRVLVISIPVYPDFDNLNVANPIYDNWSGTSRGNHALCVIGYDDAKQAFKIINSWGTGWGDSGFSWIDDIMLPCIGREHYRSLCRR